MKRTPLPAGDIELLAEAPLPTRHGEFRTCVFEGSGQGATDPVALVRGDVRAEDVLVRIHAECLTGETFGSLECDCAQRLDQALERIAYAGRGVLVYLRQGGQSLERAGAPEDAREYVAAAAILHKLGVGSVRLMTDNSQQASALSALGVTVSPQNLGDHA